MKEDGKNVEPEKEKPSAKDAVGEVVKKAPKAPVEKVDVVSVKAEGEIQPGEEASTEAVEEKVEELSVQRIYVGPGRPGLITNTVYSDGYPLPVQEMISKCPQIEKLMVKISRYSESRKKVREKGTLEHANAEKVLEFFKKGDNK